MRDKNIKKIYKNYNNNIVKIIKYNKIKIS